MPTIGRPYVDVTKPEFRIGHLSVRVEVVSSRSGHYSCVSPDTDFLRSGFWILPARFFLARESHQIFFAERCPVASHQNEAVRQYLVYPRGIVCARRR